MNRILKNLIYHAPWLLSDRKFIESLWELRCGRKLNLDNPVTFNEKLQWLKAYDHRKDYFIMADKIESKRYVASIIGEEHIIPTIAIYDNAAQIDWEALPSQFVLKCSHDSGGMVLCRDKSKLDKAEAARTLNRCLRKKFYYQSREWCYKGIKPRLICEKLMSDEKQQKSLVDYKFFCFHGTPEFLYVSYGLEDHSTASISFTDMDGNRMPFHRSDFKEIGDPIPLPEHFQEMKIIAEKLAKTIDNKFIRVDLYEICGKIYFSELTFYPNGGFLPFVPEEWDRKLGDLIKL